MVKPEPRDSFLNSWGISGCCRGIKRRKKSKDGSFSSKGNGWTNRLPLMVWVVLMLTTDGPCFSARSVKSGSVWAQARPEANRKEAGARRGLIIVSVYPKSAG